MDEELTALLQSSVANWARRLYHTKEIVIGSAARDEEDAEEEADRYLVDFAVRQVGYWAVAEVWLENGRVVTINDLGEGLPLENADWPWPSEEIA